MAKPDPQRILEDAQRLQSDRFKRRDSVLEERRQERYNETTAEVPPAYRKTTGEHMSNIIDDEGRQIATLVFAFPTPHLPAPSPEQQDATTSVERVLVAAQQELEDRNGPVWWQCTSAQTHDNCGVIYAGAKRKPYARQPKPPADTTDIDMLVEFAGKNMQYKQDAGINSVLDYRYVPTLTYYPAGPSAYDPDRVYEIKNVSERDLMSTYGVTKNQDGSFSKKTEDPTTTPAGYPDDKTTESMVKVVEYWDRDWCMIVAEETQLKWMGRRQVRGGFVLEEWEHNWGRTPYFPRPAFVTEHLEEHRKFAGPLDGIYTEMPEHRMLRTMARSIAYQTAFAPLKVITKEMGEAIVDDSGAPVTFLELEPGKARQLAPGQDVMPVGQSPEVKNFYIEMQASEARIQRFTLSPVAKGISPGADTANAALSNLHRFQLSTLDPMAKQTARQGRAMFKFWLERFRELGETVYVLDRETDTYLALAPEDIVSVNIQVEATPDQGQQQLLIEKHATELWQAQAISKIDMYEMMGYENPEEKARAVEVEQFAATLKPIIYQQVTTLLGMTDAIKAMVQASQQTGSAANAIPGLVSQAQGMQEGQQPSGMGQGAQGQPREPGVRMPTEDVNTQAAQTNGY